MNLSFHRGLILMMQFKLVLTIDLAVLILRHLVIEHLHHDYLLLLLMRQ